MEALYRKYRPSTFADVVGQEHIERTLKNAIEQDKVSNAYFVLRSAWYWQNNHCAHSCQGLNVRKGSHYRT